MTDNDLAVAKSIGALETDVRTLKHDVSNVSTKIDGLSNQISQINNQQSRGVGFFAGMGVVVTAFGGVILVMFKLLFGGIIAGGRIHP